MGGLEGLGSQKWAVRQNFNDNKPLGGAASFVWNLTSRPGPGQQDVPKRTDRGRVADPGYCNATNTESPARLRIGSGKKKISTVKTPLATKATWTPRLRWKVAGSTASERKTARTIRK